MIGEEVDVSGRKFHSQRYRGCTNVFSHMTSIHVIWVRAWGHLAWYDLAIYVEPTAVIRY